MKKIFILLLAVVALALSALIWYRVCVGYQAKQPTKFSIKTGESVAAIGANLKAAGLIKSELAFKIYLKLHQENNLLAGDYSFPSGSRLADIVRRLTKGEADFAEKDILIKEGMSLKDINKYLQDNKLINGDCDKLLNSKIKNLPAAFADYDFLRGAPKNADLEGYLFPDTYRIFADADCQDLVMKMLNNFAKKVDVDMLTEIKRQGKSLYEVLTMASLLEKEVRTEADMKIVAGIFWDRIKNGQRLESCATLAYILGENKPQYTIADTQIDSPYNTYRNDGLPPSPIDNPGLTAIRAAIYPTKTAYNYFLSRPDNGETVFSVTYQEHLANKNKYLR